MLFMNSKFKLLSPRTRVSCEGERSNAKQTKGFLVNRALDRGGDHSDYRRHRHPEPAARQDRRKSGLGGGLAAYSEYSVHRLLHQLRPISRSEEHTSELQSPV